MKDTYDEKDPDSTSADFLNGEEGKDGYDDTEQLSSNRIKKVVAAHKKPEKQSVHNNKH